MSNKPDETGADVCEALATEREERQRLQSELDLRNCALDSASTQFMILDVIRTPWTIVYVNRAVAKDHGYEPAELLGQNAAMLTPAAENKVAFARLSKAVQDGASGSAELIARRKDGSTFWIGMALSPLRQCNMGSVYYLAIGADITARLEQERAQRLLQEQLRLAQKLESVGRLAAGIAHEINTPIQYIGDSVWFLQGAQADLDQLLTTYRTAFQQLRDNDSVRAARSHVQAAEDAVDLTLLNTEIPRAFERTLEGVGRVAAIVRAMKEFAHPDAGEQSPADLNHAIQTTLTVAHNEYKYCAQIETDLGELPPVICHVGELNQVFLNLLVNAAHAIAESGKDREAGRITIATRVTGESVEISVSDNGCGIPAENLEKIFDLFFTTKPVGRGTGQGLAITRTIVTEKHGGSLDVHSEVGSGTCFVLCLPIAGRQAPPAT